MCDHRLQCMHSCIQCMHSCSMHEGRGYRYTFQRARVASSPEVPKVTWWKIATFLGYHLHWLTSLETSRHFRKIALRLGIFLVMFRECLCVVARQLAPKCRDFSNVAKLARQCKRPYKKTTRTCKITHGADQFTLGACHLVWIAVCTKSLNLHLVVWQWYKFTHGGSSLYQCYTWCSHQVCYTLARTLIVQ